VTKAPPRPKRSFVLSWRQARPRRLPLHRRRADLHEGRQLRCHRPDLPGLRPRPGRRCSLYRPCVRHAEGQREVRHLPLDGCRQDVGPDQLLPCGQLQLALVPGRQLGHVRAGLRHLRRKRRRLGQAAEVIPPAALPVPGDRPGVSDDGPGMPAAEDGLWGLERRTASGGRLSAKSHRPTIRPEVWLSSRVKGGRAAAADRLGPPVGRDQSWSWRPWPSDRSSGGSARDSRHDLLNPIHGRAERTTSPESHKSSALMKIARSPRGVVRSECSAHSEQKPLQGPLQAEQLASAMRARMASSLLTRTQLGDHPVPPGRLSSAPRDASVAWSEPTSRSRGQALSRQDNAAAVPAASPIAMIGAMARWDS